MRKFNNPLNNIKIASPCAADWDKMYGNERQRHCSDCKLNVYNLSEMTQIEAENFLINAEGRFCLQVYRRQDGTVLTKDCPVGWRAIKNKVSRLATASLTLLIGFFGGILSLESLKSLRSFTNYDKVPEIFFQTKPTYHYEPKDGEPSFGGMIGNLHEIQEDIFKNRRA